MNYNEAYKKVEEKITKEIYADINNKLVKITNRIGQNEERIRTLTKDITLDKIRVKAYKKLILKEE